MCDVKCATANILIVEDAATTRCVSINTSTIRELASVCLKFLAVTRRRHRSVFSHSEWRLQTTWQSKYKDASHFVAVAVATGGSGVMTHDPHN